ncbi:hypothetical protein [Mycobacterium ostraviense]|uniref:Transposase n=1 Tax=Mycobacterium ostraviense TaxID=2738409 RepID=A0A163W7X5_9MYCO|nr:hypothetical protein [Mycobacterium ostraviense]KZS58083.1 hypothetical protein A4G28_05695 [Mycobacterium ostraviense]UGT92824.1 hypothetical protein LTS72_05545 [Mycobacterium ostraviense]
MNFEFASTIDGNAINAASIIDEHTRQSLLDMVERSITAERSSLSYSSSIVHRGQRTPMVRMDNGPELAL